MASPFPGMDPYLEGYLWQDVHQSLASQLKRQLSGLVRPRYVVRLAVYFVSDPPSSEEIGVLYPDVEVVRPKITLHEPRASLDDGTPGSPITPPSMIAPAALPRETRITSIQVRDVAGNDLVTAIELISPANKREPGLTAYRRKRDEFRRAGVHLLEIDLIRRGERPWAPAAPPMPACHYVMTLTRAGQSQSELWALQLSEALPVLPVPLRSPDPDVPLDLPAALNAIYDESDYGRTIDYVEAPPPPAMDAATARWLDERLRDAGLR